MRDPRQNWLTRHPVRAAGRDIALSSRREIVLPSLVLHEITQALNAMHDAKAGAHDRLLRLVYEELRRVASGKMAREQPGATLQATELVHEAWIRLGGDRQPKWENRAHFFGAAAEAMRRILIDRARQRKALRRGAGQAPLNLDDFDVALPTDDDRLLAINEALEKLTTVDPRKAELVKLRHFAGLTIEDAASTMGISDATAKRWWVFARAWLNRELAADIKQPT